MHIYIYIYIYKLIMQDTEMMKQMASTFTDMSGGEGDHLAD